MVASLWPDMKAPRAVEPVPQWLLTFADLVALLLVFFVLLFSMKEINHDRWEELTGSFKGVFAPRDAVIWKRPDSFNNADFTPRHRNRDALAYLDSLMHQRLGGDEVWGGMEGRAAVSGKEMVYRIPALVFEGNTLSTEGEEAVRRLAAIVRNWDNTLMVRVIAPNAAQAREGFAQVVELQKMLLAQGVASLEQSEWQVGGETGDGGVFLAVGGKQ